MVSLEKHASWCFEVAYHPSNPSGVHIVGTQQEKNCNDQNLRTKCFLYSPKNWIYKQAPSATKTAFNMQSCKKLSKWLVALRLFAESTGPIAKSTTSWLHTYVPSCYWGQPFLAKQKSWTFFFSALLLISSHFFNPFFVSICKSYVFSFVRPEPRCLHAEYIQNQSLRCMAQTVS